ncbi:MAG: TspO/MBR family protein [Balneolaceae bacterium]|nr:TspO/MBR family protein [Balneolaceae bacterium]
MTNTKKLGGLLGWLLLCFSAGAIGAYFEPGMWYELLAKPAWTPPNWVFPVVWPILYVCMGVAAWMIWKEFTFEKAQYELRWFFVQLGLNAAWSWLFFGQHNIGIALAEIIMLWVAICFTMMLFWRRNIRAGYLMVPYLLWVSYALALNYSIWQLN